MGFEVGDRVRYKPEHQSQFGSEIHTVKLASCDVATVTNDNKYRTTDWLELVEPVKGYEAGWSLNDGLVKIPEGAKVLKDDTGDIVAFKLVKRPVIVEHKRYYSKLGQCYSDRSILTTRVVIFTEIDGVLESVRMEKL